VRLILNPLREPPHSRVVSELLYRVITSCKVCVVDSNVNVSVTGAAQGNRPVRVAPLELLPTLLPTLHLPGAGARQEMVTGETILPDWPAAQFAPVLGAMH